MIYQKISTLILFLAFCNLIVGQVPIINASLNSYGQPQLEIEAQADKYYLLTALHEPSLSLETITSITMGVDGNMIISEPLGSYPLQNYTITEHSIANPDDTDGDGIDDITEFNNMPTDAPLNFANEVPIIDGTTSVNNYDSFTALSVVENDIPWAPFLNNQEFVKFAILNQDTDEAEVYFINSATHGIHASFLGTINTTGADITTGEIVYNPNIILPNGAIGSYSFNYSFGDAVPFNETQRTFELLAANMPYLQNNLVHFISANSENDHINNYQDDFVGSRITVTFESEVFADVDYIPFNKTEGFGFFRHMDIGENPGSRDIVLYDALPNTLPRVGGIITSVVQTPLSHVNLRAIQDNVPNAYIKDPLAIDSIANLLDSYIYYRVDQSEYFIRSATQEEVNDWFEALRPTEPQIPERDLSITSILPLDDIEFEMSTAFGAKCSNVATMRNFGFPEGTIPDGFGIPFYFYDEFMKFNDFYVQVEEMISDPLFISDLETRVETLKDFRDEIKAAPMPQWMWDELQTMHDAFPEGTAVRCRSSTNNEDLPGFSGAGLYTSKTQHLDEGHISKSVKQVYASMWNFRAYEERDFYRVDQYIAAMGILCHPNYQLEKSNGVGVSIDPVYLTENTFYLNTQVGESLITNPDPNAIPEEILLHQDPTEGYTLLRESNLVLPGQLVMEEAYLDQMRDYLGVIHDEFAILYNVVGAEGFGMDIEYKITAEDQLIIKQARPWVSFWADIKAVHDLAPVEVIEPQNSSTLTDSELITVNIANQGLENMSDFEISLLVENVVVETMLITETLTPQISAEYQFTVPQDFSAIGDYNIGVIVSDTIDGYPDNDTLNVVVSHLHELEGGIEITDAYALCGDEIEVKALISNYGETTFTDTEIEVMVNGMAVETINYTNSIPYLAEIELTISISENLQINDNEIILNIVSINGLQDAVSSNNTSTFNTNLDSEYESISIVINADNYAEETSWDLFDALNNELIAAGSLEDDQDGQMITFDVCVDYSSCFSLNVYDTFGDGICCSFGQGNFSVLNSAGEELAFNNGDFGDQGQEQFCPNGEGCAFTATITTSNTSNETASDGSITISPTTGFDPYTYSIDGGQNFVTFNTINNLPAGEYMIVVMDASGSCTYEETITVDFNIESSLTNISDSNIKVYPNPTTDQLIIELEDDFGFSGAVNIEVFDSFGRLIQQEVIKGNTTKVNISMKAYASGNYVVKCFNEEFDTYFRIVKID